MNSLLFLFTTFCVVSLFTIIAFIKDKPKEMEYASGLLVGSWISLCALLANFVVYIITNN